MDRSGNSKSSQSDSESYATISSQPPKRRAGRTKFRETRHPTYKGVRRRNNNRWVCEVREPNKKSRIWLGTFPTPEMAARAHDVAALALRGRAACLNFADSPHVLPVAESSSPADIQRAAAAAAEMFRPSKEGAECERSEVEGAECENEMMQFLNDNDDDSGLRMDTYFDDMARGMLMDPPPQSFVPDYYEVENDGEISLWSFSV